MIALIALLAAEPTVPARRYEICGQSADNVPMLIEAVRKSRKFRPVRDSGDWNAVSNRRDTTWLFPTKFSGAAIVAVCRQLVTERDGTYMKTEIACDGSDAECDAVRNQLIGSAAQGGRTER